MDSNTKLNESETSQLLSNQSLTLRKQPDVRNVKGESL
jgi:hypothetical protein